MIEFLNKVVAYFTENPIQLAIAGGIAVILLATVIALIVVGAKASKRKKAARKIAAEVAASVAEAATTVVEPAPEEAVAEPVVDEAVATPVADEAVSEPVVDEAVAEPVADEAVAEPVAEEAPVEPTTIVDEKAATPVEEAPAPVVKKVTAATLKKEPAPKKETPAPETAPVVEEKAAPAPTETPVEAPVETVSKAAPAPVETAPKAKKTTKPAEKKVPAAPVKKEAAPKAKPQEKPATRYAGKWVVCKLQLTDSNDETVEESFFFELRASNGELLLTSEAYTTYAGAVKGIQTHKDNVEKGNFRIVPSKKGDYIFKLLTAKNTLLCTGANYKTLERCESAVASTKRFAATAVLQEDVETVRIKMPVEDANETEPEIPDNGYTGKWIINTTQGDGTDVMYYFELFASNGEKLLTSEEYTTYEGAVNAVETHKANIAKGNFRISITKRGDFIFKLLGGNNQLLCLGEHYKTRSRCESAVESVKRFSKSAPVYMYGETNN